MGLFSKSKPRVPLSEIALDISKMVLRTANETQKALQQSDTLTRYYTEVAGLEAVALALFGVKQAVTECIDSQKTAMALSMALFANVRNAVHSTEFDSVALERDEAYQKFLDHQKLSGNEKLVGIGMFFARKLGVEENMRVAQEGTQLYLLAYKSSTQFLKEIEEKFEIIAS